MAKLAGSMKSRLDLISLLSQDLPLYLAEFSFRHNHREDSDIVGTLIAGC